MSIRLSSILVIVACVSQIIKSDITKPVKSSVVREDHEQYEWLVNAPPNFHEHLSKNGTMIDAKSDAELMAKFESERQFYLDNPCSHTDGEVIDAVDHYFWGMTHGLSMELGGLDGSHSTRSMTASFEEKFKWKRIIVEGNPLYRQGLVKKSPLAFGVNAVICSDPTIMHYSSREYIGGLLEFMSQKFLRDFHTAIYRNCTPHGNLSSVDFTKFSDVIPVACIPLSQVLHRAHVKHINYFVLDVEVRETKSNVSDLPNILKPYTPRALKNKISIRLLNFIQ